MKKSNTLKGWIVITSINYPTETIKAISELCRKQDNFSAVVVGDKKTPADWNYEHIHYLSIADQKNLFPELDELIPYNHYCRKNLGYLYAIKNGADFILETDDDNIPYYNFGQNISREVESHLVTGSKWINIYKYFTNSFVWPRGLPLDEVHSQGQIIKNLNKIDSPIQQYLADEDPDVDAIFRLLFKETVSFNADTLPVALDQGSWTPFNSQNTLFFKDAFPLLYLPCTVSFRMTDIWRSFVAQAVLWMKELNLTFHPATVRQERNVHNLMKDFNDEVVGYQNNKEMMDKLWEFVLEYKSKKGEEDFFTLATRCWSLLIDSDFIDKGEKNIIDAWSETLKNIQEFG